MGTLFLFVGLAALLLLMGVRDILITWSILLLTPTLAFFAGYALPTLTSGVFYAQGALLAMVAVLVTGARWGAPWPTLRDLTPYMVFVFAYSLVYNLCLLWPDFISIGERLRDYALLNSVIDSPLVAREPWLPGETLNYYLYWYRFGQMLHEVVRIPVWEVYHQLQSFTFAFYLTALFLLFQRYARFSVVGALLCAVVISFGSNFQGVVHFLTMDDNWWGPSRVIKNTINEFPAWSLLLGDVHPHYLNLPLIPFLVLVLAALAERLKGRWGHCALFVAGAMPVLWVYNANAWETPVWLGVFLVAATATALHWLLRQRTIGGGSAVANSSTDAVVPEIPLTPLDRWVPFVLMAATVLFGAIFLLASGNITRPDAPLTFVSAPVSRSALWSRENGGLFQIWGMPLLVIAASLLLLIPRWSLRLIGILGILISLLCNLSDVTWLAQLSSTFFLVTTLGLLVLFSLRKLSLWRDEPLQHHIPEVVFLVVGITGLTFLLLGETIYFKDSYGVDLARMNTIFKFYSSSWWMVHAVAIFLGSQALPVVWRKPVVGLPLRSIQLAMVVLLCGFTFRTVDLRKSKGEVNGERAEGLSLVQREFQGAADTVRRLRAIPRTVVLEAQGPPYSYTSHVSTLSGHDAYLGWANHVNLLLKRYDEVKRREDMTKRIYESTACSEIETLLRQEGIAFLVWGPLEKRAFPNTDPARFGCLTQFTQSGEYAVFSPAPRMVSPDMPSTGPSVLSPTAPQS